MQGAAEKLLEIAKTLRQTSDASQDAAEKLKRLQAWCAEAEASGVRALQEYAIRLRGYALVPA